MRPDPRPVALLALLLYLLAAPAPLGADEPDLEKVIERGIATISKAKARAHVAYLAGPKCEGRASGEKGCDVAAEYLVARLTEFGVEPGAPDGYRQEFTVRNGPFPGQRVWKGGPPETRPTSNVIGMVDGSDDRLAKEIIVLGGHYDHLGYRDLRKRKVYWGADDNASGVAAVLLVAQALAEAELKPRRSVMFVFFSGEERGLFGSKKYVGSPAWPLAKTVTMINLDMVGRNKPVEMNVYGTTSSPAYEELIRRHERASGFHIKRKGGTTFQLSDHYAFYEKHVPVLFFTSGLHKDYHDMDDEPKRLNFGKVERIAEHCLRLIYDIGNADERPAWQAVSASGAGAVLGFTATALSKSELAEWEVKRGKGAVVVTEVRENGPAAEAGMLEGDVVLGLANKLFSDKDPIDDLDEIAADLKKGKKYALLLLRDRNVRKVLTVKVP